MVKPTKPKFLSSNPSGLDLFEGKSHEKTANTLFELIEKRAFPNNVIGLEGNWGSGKSNVIKILNEKFNKVESDYSFFTYDAWAHQEDLTRRTFLEELITQLQSENKFEDVVDWDKELEKLLARSTISTVEKFPKIKFYWIVIMGALLLFGLLDKVFTDFFESRDLIKDFDARYLKLFLFKYLFPIIAFIWGFYEMYKEYRQFDNDEKTAKLNWKKRLKRLFYIFSGKDLTTEEHSHVIEKEPSVKQFKDYFRKITGDLNNDGIIIVFDNMDRLTDSSKVQSLWSSIYTFFAEVKIENVWVIIPYDRKHLAKHFNTENDDAHTIDNFLGKTFSTVFRIAPPVLSDWKRFFEIKFKEAFPDQFDNETIEFISTLFELIIPSYKRNPRDIITFLNNLVALYLQHPESIKIKYLSLFALRKEEILNNPLVSISSKGFFNGEAYLFDDIEELEESLGAIVYNVDKNKANEVLLKNSIEEIIYKGNINLLEKVKKHTEFAFYFNNILNHNGLDKRNPKTVVDILSNVEDVIEKATLNRHWINFAHVVTGNNREETKLEEWHKTAMLKANKNWARKIAQKLIEQAKWELNKSVDQQSYYCLLDNIFKFINENIPNVTIVPPFTTFDPGPFIDYIDDMRGKFRKGIYNFKDFNIYCKQEDIESFYLDKENDFINSLYDYRDSIAFLIENENYNFPKLKDKVSDVVIKVPHTQKEDINKLVAINKVLFNQKTWPKFSESTGLNYLMQQNTQEPAYPFIIASQLNYLTNAAAHPHFVPILNKADLGQEVAPVAQYFLDLSDLFQIYFQKNKKTVLIKDLIHHIIEDSYGFKRKLNIEWVFKNLHQIKSSLYPENFTEFLIFFDKWKSDFGKISGKSTTHFNSEIIKMTFDKDLHDYKAIESIYNTVIEDMRSINSEEWMSAFKDKNIHFVALEGYLRNSILKPTVTKGKEFMDSYSDYNYQIARREISIPNSVYIWEKLIAGDYLHQGKINRIYNDILDYLLSHSELNSSEIKFYISGILKYASNIYTSSKADDVIRKFILPLNSSKEILDEIISRHKNSFIDLINSSTHQYDQDLYDLLQEGLEDGNLNPDPVEEILTKGSIKTKETKKVKKEE